MADGTEKNNFIIKLDDIRFPYGRPDNPPPIFFATGNASLINSPTLAILNSRKPRQIRPNDPWVLAGARLFEKFGQGKTIVTSLGNQQYELIAALAGRHSNPVIFVLDQPLPSMLDEKKQKLFLSQYGDLLPPDNFLMLSPFKPDALPNKKERAIIRDECVVALAHEIAVAEIRSGGNMESLAALALKQGKQVKAYSPNKIKRSVSGNFSLINSGAQTVHLEGIDENSKSKKPDLKTMTPVDLAGSFLFHFTKTCPGPWPGQSLNQYYQALLDDQEGSSHTAADTLHKILLQGIIKGSGRMIRKGYPVVSLTHAPLSELHELVKWRPGLIRWTFEPYGLAIPKKILMGLGARPVVYGREDVFAKLPEDKKHLFQYHNPPETDWVREKEWRLAGDLSLAEIPKNEIKIILPSYDETENRFKEFGCEIILL